MCFFNVYIRRTGREDDGMFKKFLLFNGFELNQDNPGKPTVVYITAPPASASSSFTQPTEALPSQPPRTARPVSESHAWPRKPRLLATPVVVPPPPSILVTNSTDGAGFIAGPALPKLHQECA